MTYVTTFKNENILWESTFKALSKAKPCHAVKRAVLQCSLQLLQPGQFTLLLFSFLS